MKYFGGACGFSIGNTAYAADTCSAVSSATAMRHHKPAESSSSPAAQEKAAVPQAQESLDPTPQGLAPIEKRPQALEPITTEPQALHPIETAPQALRPVNPEPSAQPNQSQGQTAVSSAEIIAALPDAVSMANSDVSSFIITCAQPNTNYAAIISVTQVIFRTLHWIITHLLKNRRFV